MRHPRAVVVMRGKDRHRFSAWGAAGGQAGTTASNIGRRAGEEPVDVGKTTVYRARQGETLSICVGGGGGYGSPLRREVALVEADVRDGLLSKDRARDVYGVAIGPDGVDQAATAALRAGRAVADGAGDIDYGPGRTAWEQRFGLAAARLAVRLEEVAPALRRPFQEQVYAALAASSPGPYGEAEVERVIGTVLEAMAHVAT